MLLRTLGGELIRSRCILVAFRFGFASMRDVTQDLFILRPLPFIVAVKGFMFIVGSILLGIFVSLTNKTSQSDHRQKLQVAITSTMSCSIYSSLSGDLEGERRACKLLLNASRLLRHPNIGLESGSVLS